MLVSTLEYYVLSEFRRTRLVRIMRKTGYLSEVRRFRLCSERTSPFIQYRASAGNQVSQSSLIELIFKKRKLSRSSIFAGLSMLTDSGCLVFYTYTDIFPTERLFELTEKGAHALNSGMLFKKAYDDENED